MNWETIRQRIQEDDENKWDLHLKGRDLTFNRDDTIAIRQNGNVQTYRLLDSALTQLCQRLAIPAHYFKRLLPSMQAELANYDLSRLYDTDFFVRGKGIVIRAVLSNRYVPYNNCEVLGAATSAVEEGGLIVRSFELEDRCMFLKLTTQTLANESLQLKAGVMISNSEVGYAQVTVEPFVFRLPCTNDLIVAKEAVFRHRHLNFSSRAFSEQITQGIGHALKLAEVAVSFAEVADQQPVQEPSREIQQLGKEWKLKLSVIATALAAYEAEPRPTRFGIANCFTRAAQRLRPIERIEVERLAGRILN